MKKLNSLEHISTESTGEPNEQIHDHDDHCD